MSRRLTDEFVNRWEQTHPAGEVVVRDLARTELKPVADQWIAASYTSARDRTAAQHAELAQSEKLINELRWADEIVLGVPMHNFGPAASVKLYIDQVVRAGETFAFREGAPVGLLADRNRTLTLIYATGGFYGPGTALSAYNFVEPYLRTVFSFIGITDITAIEAGGAMALAKGAQMHDFIQPYLQRVEGQFAPWKL